MKNSFKKVYQALFQAAALAIVLVFSFQPVSSCAQTTPQEESPFVHFKIVLQHHAGRLLTEHTGIIRRYKDRDIPPDVWVPSELLAQLKVPVALNAKKSHFTLRIPHPADNIGVPALKTLAPEAIDLDFKALVDDEVQYFNLAGLESVTGISYILSGEPKGYEEAMVVGLRPFMPQADRWKDAPGEPEKLPAPFNLVWDHVIKENPDLSEEEPLPSVSVISPTWFALSNENGGIFGNASRAYVYSAHKMGYHVWALVSNGFNRERTTKFLADPGAQDIFIARMLAYAGIFGFDGINIDFESVANEDASRLTAFVKKFASHARPMGLKISIDVMIPTKWSTCYERRALSEAVDYVALMAYDEHWRTAPKAGSTASLPWVSKALENTLQEVPAAKLLLGIPLYTREWEETKDKNGKVKVKSKTMAMASVDLRLGETSAEKKWLGPAGQHYFHYVSDDRTYRVWVEDEKSISLRMELADKHKLAGAAFWRKGFERHEIWAHVEKATEKRSKGK